MKAKGCSPFQPLYLHARISETAERVAKSVHVDVTAAAARTDRVAGIGDGLRDFARHAKFCSGIGRCRRRPVRQEGVLEQRLQLAPPVDAFDSQQRSSQCRSAAYLSSNVWNDASDLTRLFVPDR